MNHNEATGRCIRSAVRWWSRCRDRDAVRCRIRHAIVALALMAGMSTQAASGLNIEDRVACETAIATVRWSYSLWPESNPKPKPPLSAILTEAEIHAQVEDSLRMGEALASLYGIHIGAAELQAELDRMAMATRAPDQLQALYDALGNDAETVAECLARPALVRKHLRDAYTWDQNRHADTRLDAEAALASAVPGRTPAGASVHEVIYVREAADRTEKTQPVHDETLTIPLQPEEWEERLAHYAAVPSIGDSMDAKHGQDISASGVRETEDAFVHETMIDAQADTLRVQVFVWPKQGFDAWWRDESMHWTGAPVPQLQEALHLTAIKGNPVDMAARAKGGPDDTWRIEQPAPSTRRYHTAVWTGSEMIIWGGVASLDSAYLNTGGRYNPATDTWSPMSVTNAPKGRGWHTAVWTGEEMLVWGGQEGAQLYLNTGGRYRPATDTWVQVPTNQAPSPRRGHTAVWTAGKMVIWGGGAAGSNTGGIYNLATETWIATPTNGAPSPRANHTAVVLNGQMIVWGGTNDETGGRYDLATSTWAPTTQAGAPLARDYHTAVVAGDEMIVWGGIFSGNALRDGGRYNPISNSWIAIPVSAGAPEARFNHTAVWTGKEMLVWGGQSFGNLGGELNSGGRYDPVSKKWSAISEVNTPSPRYAHTAVWTGEEMIVWGGSITQSSVGTKTGGRYRPDTDTWLPTGGSKEPETRFGHSAIWTGNRMIIWGGYSEIEHLRSGGAYSPDTAQWTQLPQNSLNPRSGHTAVWTGEDMIIWGGTGANGSLNTGMYYTPTTNAWTDIATDGAPSARYGHTAVWTGTQMIVWGGYDANGYQKNGGRYTPDAPAWTTMTTSNAPSARNGHAAVWTGDAMVVWGGAGDGGAVNTGGRYLPATNAWWALPAPGAPSARTFPTAVWTGEEVIVWGGANNGSHLNTGARYHPGDNAWKPMQQAGAPVGRYAHTAIWTGLEMIVWGGFNGTNPLNTGGRYRLADDTWSATTTMGAPPARYSHTAVWTGDEMIVWGGSNGNPLNSLGAYSADGIALFADGFEE